jgi:hypothetical protein
MIKRRNQDYRYKEEVLLFRRATLARVTILLFDDSRSVPKFKFKNFIFHDLVLHSISGQAGTVFL